jgi:hypothetical protein
MSIDDLRVYDAEGSPGASRTEQRWLEPYPPWRAPLEKDPSIYREDIPELSTPSKRRGRTYVSSSVNPRSAQDKDDLNPTDKLADFILSLSIMVW